MKYLIVDAANTFFRARHSALRQSDPWEKLGFAIHVTLASINKAWRDQKADHVVICLEGRSWRKTFYTPYKANRAVARAAKTETEQEEEQMFWDAFDAMKTFLSEKTNCTVLQHGELEADDLIAGWIQTHPNDHHTIVSSDTDFYQTLSENVNQYNGISDELHTLTGILDKRGKLVIDKKTKLPKVIPDPKFILFEKCMRGDPTDNIFSAYPGVRTKGTKNKVGLIEAYGDKGKQGYAWNNLMLQRWTDHNGLEHKVLDDYNRNVTLVDLTAQPTEYRVMIEETVKNNAVSLNRAMIGAQFLKFCGKYDLIKLSDNASAMAGWMSAGYPASSVTLYRSINS
jgi:5'-3' exonuclease